MPRKKSNPTITEKLCGTCNKVLPVALFSKHRDGYQSKCKSCTKTYLRLYLYGVDEETFQAIAAEGCAICGYQGSKLAVDHCHETGEIRGVLCQKCNGAIGQLGDTVESLTKAVEYLRRTGTGIIIGGKLGAGIKTAED